MDRFRGRWTAFHEDYWFKPAVGAAFLALVALVVVRIDEQLDASSSLLAAPASAAAARSILTTIAGSLITVAGLTLSLTVVTLQLVSGQHTPRAIRGILTDGMNQFAAGSFIGIFAFCLFVLRAVRDESATAPAFVPAIGLALALALALAGLILLLVFIHHTAGSIQVSTIAGRIAAETARAIDRLYPATLGAPVEENAEALLAQWAAEGDGVRVLAGRTGYVRGIDLERIAKDLAAHATHVELTLVPGQFVTEATSIARVWTVSGAEDPGGRIRDAMVVADQRDMHQDARFGIRQLVDIGLRAVSPGVNDPTTALTCIGYLRMLTERLTARELPARHRRYPAEGIEIVVPGTSYRAVLEEAFLEIARYALADPVVVSAIVAALSDVAALAHGVSAERERVARSLGQEILTASLERVPMRDDRRRLLTRFAALSGPPAA